MSFTKFIRSGLNWLTDHLIEHWPAYIVLLASGGGTTYAAKATSWINAFGPIAWVGCGLVGGLVGLCMYGVLVWLRGKKIDQNLAQSIAERSGVSPTLQNYEDLRIHLNDFFNPYYVAYNNKVFRRCQVWGPSLVYLKDVTFDRCTFKHVQIVIVRTDQALWGITAFERASFIDCEVSNFTLVMNRQTYEALDPKVRIFVPVINENTS